MSRTDRTITLLVTATAVTALGGCFLGTGGGGGGKEPEQPKTGLDLTFDNAYDQLGDDVGGAKQMETIPLVWEGTRAGGEGGPGDAFHVDDSTFTYATDPWSKSTLVPNLTPGSWSLAVTVNGATYACPDAIDLPDGTLVNVTFTIDKTSGTFAGCTSY